MDPAALFRVLCVSGGLSTEGSREHFGDFGSASNRSDGGPRPLYVVKERDTLNTRLCTLAKIKIPKTKGKHHALTKVVYTIIRT